ncbi:MULTISPECIES: DUF4011 domain-containing protein [unclassified Bradyrhizobium]|uniref:DUF4011 domain-containing protein n=1 Tax=unclassified Bradyrhizobium TaxID=2631580 RepID=UPI001CD7A64D|nr:MULTISPECIES: DUF4011 domain-containing protein [unclassified Bradyrhizobium]MCA1386123.1 DUF4011 domain-containing protein [Bradyrhizobium sp. BRP05]MCA1394205.1 DUF4011 domain-containing protein [Bradyrhizobium sp. IC3123]MCA1423664.1 DUF4011 domain-containing protein [Bradyrhizobium sp. BRP23]MCA1430676.1 DUF4011 domain-containing protein [Bradyrhizobium sp. NBAIM16]MCA1480302.1 DUF4011 domain-containing protein [Bradyrhizobium sp. NBAIM08]
MLNYSLGARSKRHLQIVDEVMEEVYRKLAGEDASLRIDPLEEPEDIPPEEKTEEFIAALEHAKVSNLEYLTKLQALESSGRDDEFSLGKLERELRDHIRDEFELPPRPKKAEINRAEHARRSNIDPNPELGRVKSKPSHSDAALQTLKFPDELERVLEKIAADARLSEQEMELSTLFLSFGFLDGTNPTTATRRRSRFASVARRTRREEGVRPKFFPFVGHRIFRRVKSQFAEASGDGVPPEIAVLRRQR